MTPEQAAQLYEAAYEAGRAAGRTAEFTSADLRSAYDIGVQVGGKSVSAMADTAAVAHRHRFTRPRPVRRTGGPR